MKGNDLGNAVVPRDVLVWEGLLGIIPDPKIAKQEQKFRERKRWVNAVALYEVNEILARQVWRMVWNTGMEIDLLTYHGHEFAHALEDRIERESLPFRRVWSEQPNILARNLIYQPDIRSIYDPFPDHQFLYGAKGRILLPEQGTLFGAM